MAEYKFVTPNNIGKGFYTNTKTKQYDINVDNFSTSFNEQGQLRAVRVIDDSAQSTYTSNGQLGNYYVMEGVNRTSHFDIRDLPNVNNLITYFDTDYYFTIPNEVVLDMDNLMQAKNLPAITSYTKIKEIAEIEEVRGVLETRMPSTKGNSFRFFTQTLHITFVGSGIQEHITFKRLNRIDANNFLPSRPNHVPLYEYLFIYRREYEEDLKATRTPNLITQYKWHTRDKIRNWDNWVLVSNGANTSSTTSEIPEPVVNTRVSATLTNPLPIIQDENIINNGNKLKIHFRLKASFFDGSQVAFYKSKDKLTGISRLNEVKVTLSPSNENNILIQNITQSTDTINEFINSITKEGDNFVISLRNLHHLEPMFIDLIAEIDGTEWLTSNSATVGKEALIAYNTSMSYKAINVIRVDVSSRLWVKITK